MQARSKAIDRHFKKNNQQITAIVKIRFHENNYEALLKKFTPEQIYRIMDAGANDYVINLLNNMLAREIAIDLSLLKQEESIAEPKKETKRHSSEPIELPKGLAQ